MPEFDADIRQPRSKTTIRAIGISRQESLGRPEAFLWLLSGSDFPKSSFFIPNPA